jgi:hypothetical protein
MVAEHIARADDHRRLLTNTSDLDDEGHHKRSAPSSCKHDEFRSGHLGVAERPLADMVTHLSSFRGMAGK